MSRHNMINKLPLDIRQELIRRIISNSHTYKELSEWLASLGHQAYISVIHRFGQKLKPKQEDFRQEEITMALQSESAMVELRMRCIEAAVHTEAMDVLRTAQTYLDWVKYTEK